MWPFNMLESGGLEFELRSHIISLCAISAYRSLYGEAHVA
jgi:hypothetical protein